MPMDGEELGKDLCRHLDLARELAGRIVGKESFSREPTRPAHRSPDLDRSILEAERRANVAEVRIAKLTRELEEVQRKTTSATRDIQRLAYQDPLTGLGNVHLLSELLEKVLSGQPKGRGVLVVLVDIDRFGVINQMLGHDIGDELLGLVAERLLGLCQPPAALAHISEDEFALVIPNLPLASAETQAAEVALQVRAVLSKPFLLQGQDITLTVSQGGAYAEGGPAQSLLSQAKTALDFAKTQGGDQSRLCDPDLHRRQRRQASLEFQMKTALENDEFFLKYLPIIWLDQTAKGQVQGTLIGVEALLRWQHRTEGVLPASEFLPAAERSGLIVPLGKRVLSWVCQQYQAWAAAGADFYIGVNLSGRQLLIPDYATAILKEVDDSTVPRQRLTFELHESFGTLDEGPVDQNLAGLAAAGFSLALNNFGEGTCSLRRLDQVNFLKLSPKALAGCPELFRKALVIAASLGKVAVAVGVETADQARFCLESGCPTMQGFYFSQPLEPNEVLKLWHSKPTWKL